MKLNWNNCFQGAGGGNGVTLKPSMGYREQNTMCCTAFQFNEALSSGCFKSFCCAINSMHTIQPFLATDSTTATELSCILGG